MVLQAAVSCVTSLRVLDPPCPSQLLFCLNSLTILQRMGLSVAYFSLSSILTRSRMCHISWHCSCYSLLPNYAFCLGHPVVSSLSWEVRRLPGLVWGLLVLLVLLSTGWHVSLDDSCLSSFLQGSVMLFFS